MDQHSRDDLAELAPSAKLVYKMLEYDRPLTQKQLVEETTLSGRTVRSAVSELEALGVVTEEVYLPDARQDLFKLTTDAPDTGTADGLDNQSARTREDTVTSSTL